MTRKSSDTLPNGAKVVAPATKGGISEKVSTTIAAFHFPAFPYPAENQTTGLRPMEMHPFCLRHLPRWGRFALH